MKTVSILVACLGLSEAFQFMKGWKMPTYDPHEEAVKARFGDKSTFHPRNCVRIRYQNSLLDTELVVLTGASSGLGRKTAKALLLTGEYHVIGAVREYVSSFAAIVMVVGTGSSHRFSLQSRQDGGGRRSRRL